jgi:6-phosphogluconolactonase
MVSKYKSTWALSMLCILCVVSRMASGQTAATASPSQFVYINDQSAHGNKVEGFSISEAGVVAPVAGSPFETGRNGGPLGFFSSRDMVLRTGKNPILYVVDGNASDITFLHINALTGELTESGIYYDITLSPPAQVNLAVSPNGRYLFFYDGGFGVLGSFSIAPNGALTQLPFTQPSPFGRLADFLITRDGKFLIATGLTQSGIAVYTVNADGSLTPVNSSPFPTAGIAEGVDVDCSGKHLFVGDSTITGVSVEVYDISRDGTLTPIPGSPFRVATGNDSATVRLSPNGKFLYVGNANNSKISVFSVAANGKLTKLSGSPFSSGNPKGTPAQMAFSRSGSFLFATDFPGNSNPPALDVVRVAN